MVFYLDGLERSGNVFLSYAIGLSFGRELRSLRTHKVETLKDYDQDKPFIVPLRDALPSIVSAKIFRDYVHHNNLFSDNDSTEIDIERIISRYKEYTSYLIESPKFFIAPFHHFIKDHNPVLEKICKFYNDPEIKIIKKYNKEDLFKQIDIKNTEEYKYHPEIGNFPRKASQEKEKMKKWINSSYGTEIKSIQDNIDILYSRYNSI